MTDLLPEPYPRIPACPAASDFGFAYEDWHEDRGAEVRLSQTKRLTDAELSAEYHRAKWTGLWAEKHGGLSDEGRAKIRTVERFMELPHYDEVTR